MRRTVNFTLSLRPGLRDRVIAAAEAEGRSASAWVSRVLVAELDRGVVERLGEFVATEGVGR